MTKYGERGCESFKIEHTALDRRMVLDDAQKDDVRAMHNKGVSIREITRRMDVSRRLIQFILFPERLARNKDLRKARGASYYKREKHTQHVREHRQYKTLLLNLKQGEQL